MDADTNQTVKTRLETVFYERRLAGRSFLKKYYGYLKFLLPGE